MRQGKIKGQGLSTHFLHNLLKNGVQQCVITAFCDFLKTVLEREKRMNGEVCRLPTVEVVTPKDRTCNNR